MSRPAISVRALTKEYRIAHEGQRVTTMGEAVARRIKKPLHRTSYERFRALDDVSFDVHQGDVLGVIGRNGAGKSTLLKVLSRITEPTAGEVRMYGRVGSLLEVGTGFHPELTGRENIFLNGAILGMRRREIERQFDAIVDFAEVEKFLDTPVKRYSSGMYVRLAFAVAAHLNPEILIVDEVLSVGDAQFQKKCLGKMQDVSRQEGRTVLFVSHNVGAIEALCSKAVLLATGRVEFHGEVEPAVGKYLDFVENSSDGDFDLSNHVGRIPNGSVLMRRLRLLAEDGRPTDHHEARRPITVELEFDIKQRMLEPQIAVTIADHMGHRLGAVGTHMQSAVAAPRCGQFVARVDITSLNLAPGQYMVGASIADKGIGLIDSIDNAGWFSVGSENLYGNGEPYGAVYGPIVWDFSWSFSEVGSNRSAGASGTGNGKTVIRTQELA